MKKELKDLLKKHDAKPSRGLGQNFLINKGVLSTIVKASEIKKDDLILEVGPGMGILTKELSALAKKVISVEKDRKMIEILEETVLKENDNVEVLNEDILKYQPPSQKYKIVANIPYYLTSPLIRKFLEAENPPSLMVLMIQKEVAQRICSKPPQMSLLAVSVQVYAKPEIISYVKKGSFWPSPKIDSAIIKISDIKNNNLDFDKNTFFKILKAGFSQPRKQLGNNLSTSLKIEREKINQWLLKNNIDPKQRSETLNLFNWKDLAKSYNLMANSK